MVEKNKKTKKQKKTANSSRFIYKKHHSDLLNSIAALFFLIIISAVFLFLYLTVKESENEAIYYSGGVGKVLDAGATKLVDVRIEDSQQKKQKILGSIDSRDWEIYENKWYGFQLKYPSGWIKPVSEQPSVASEWEYKYKFRKTETGDGADFDGFDVLVYDLARIKKDLQNSEEILKVIKPAETNKEACPNADGFIEDGVYLAKMVNIPPGERCYSNPVFFSSAKGEKYMFNLVPVGMSCDTTKEDLSETVLDKFPEFYIASNSFGFVDIVRPKPKPVITAPMPVAYKKKDGKRVCLRDNDKPGKSKQGKGIHMDMECCLDPDEIPNPHCYYPLEKYAKVFEQIKNRK